MIHEKKLATEKSVFFNGRKYEQNKLGLWLPQKELSEYKKILLVGNSGGGKSTTADYVGKVSDHRVIHTDLVRFSSGLIPVPDAISEKIINDFLKVNPKAVIDFYGDNHALLKRFSEYADLILFFNFGIDGSFRGFQSKMENHAKGRPPLGIAFDPNYASEGTVNTWRLLQTAQEKMIPEWQKIFKQSGADVIELSNFRDVDKFKQEFALSCTKQDYARMI